jgi:hypothetical protein
MTIDSRSVSLPSESANASEVPGHEQVVCTLFEGHYHFGLGALVNSILNGGFSGLVWAGYRGELPPWTTQLRSIGPGLFELPNGAQLGFEKLSPGVHFANYKPDFMLHLIRNGTARKQLWYVDPDITVRCSWKFFERWAEFGVSLCSDITNGSMPVRHPLRCMWVEVARKAGWGEPVSPQARYFNSGFVGLGVANASFLRRWKDAIGLVEQSGTDLNAFMPGSREDPFYAADQDALNLTAMYATEPISAIGPEGMGFVPGGFTMYHSVGSPKPWKKPFLRSALSGVPPSNGDKHFLACARGPIQPYSAGELKRMRVSAALASLIGRFYKRS